VIYLIHTYIKQANDYSRNEIVIEEDEDNITTEYEGNWHRYCVGEKK